MKTCTRCQERKACAEFAANHAVRDGRASWCRTCTSAAVTERRRTPDGQAVERAYKRSPAGKASMRATNLRRRFGITPEEYEALWVRQAGLCAICERPETGSRHTVDHDHATGEVRSLLCRTCNAGLGQFKDAPALLRSATAYLETV